MDRFFKDKKGRWAVIQPPNFLISAWFLLVIANLVIHNSSVSRLQGAVLFAWAYLELTDGVSYFRKTLGGVVLLLVVIGFFM